MDNNSQSNNVSPEDILKEIIELKRKGYSNSLIGKTIKEKYNINIKEYFKKKLSKILLENNIKDDYPEELSNIFRRINRLLKHLETNKKDIYAKRSLERLESEIPRLVKYYKKKKLLSESFEYNRDITKMFSS